MLLFTCCLCKNFRIQTFISHFHHFRWLLCTETFKSHKWSAGILRCMANSYILPVDFWSGCQMCTMIWGGFESKYQKSFIMFFARPPEVFSSMYLQGMTPVVFFTVLTSILGRYVIQLLSVEWCEDCWASSWWNLEWCFWPPGGSNVFIWEEHVSLHLYVLSSGLFCEVVLK